MKKYSLAFIAVLLAIGAFGKDILDIPVSAVTNRVYLSDMEGRPWWNDAWRKRAAILVSNVSDVRVSKAMIDFAFDVGEEIDPKDVRVVTPWGTEVPCCAERVRSAECGVRSVAAEPSAPNSSTVQPFNSSTTSVEVVFQTSLRERENRPFFVYWDNPAAKTAEVRSPITMGQTSDTISVNNGVIDVTFDNLHRTPGLIRTLRVNASDAESELLWRTTEYAWGGFEFWTGAIGTENWSEGKVVTDNALKKTIRFSGKSGDLDFIFYAGQPRVDYAYRLKPGFSGANISVTWAPGGNVGYDDFYYVGLAGKELTFPASIDHPTDSLKQPEYYNFPWMATGWYAIRDRKSHDVVGMVFDRDATFKVGYLGRGQSSGLCWTGSFNHKLKNGESATGSGAIVATIGEASVVRREYEFLRNRPKVFIGKVQPWQKIPVKVPDLAHDFCINCNVGGWHSSTPLEGYEWSTNIIKHIQALGANTILLGQLSDYRWTDLALTKEDYDKIVEAAKPIIEKRKMKVPEWSPENFNTARLEKITGAAHGNGVAVCTWHGPVPGFNLYGNLFNEVEAEANQIIQPYFAKAGVNSVFNPFGMGEGPAIPGDIIKAKGSQYWKWDDPSEFFKIRRETADQMRRFYEHSHKECPNAAVMGFHSDNTELGRDMCMPYFVGTMDTYFCEFVAHFDYDKVKHTAKRQRAFFDNEDGRTIFAHYYFMEYDYSQRIRQTELPFTCGINGFSQESMTYENFDRDFFEITADFNRFAMYTRLGEKAAKMGPVKNLAVFRDMNCFEQDIIQHRTSKRSWWDVSRHDLRGNAFAELYNYNYDVVFNPFFNAKSLSRYNVVYIPDDEVFTEELAKELLAFVEQGGGAVLEGATAESCSSLKKLALVDGEVKSIGKGKVVWTKEILTDKLIKHDAKTIARVKELLAAVGSKNPYEIEARSIDGVLQASSEGMLLGVYNRSERIADTGKVTINCSTVQPFNCSTDNLFVLDVKSGIRFPYKDGFEITVGPQQCGFYLIGDEAFTAIPEANEAKWMGASATSTIPNGKAPDAVEDPDFVALEAVEFVSAIGKTFAGDSTFIRRSADAKFIRHRFCRADRDDINGVEPYEKRKFVRALEKSRYVHIKTGAADCDSLFEECAGELGDFLKRGGGILFDGVVPGTNAKKFLESIGVFDPSDSLKSGIGDGRGMWSPDVPATNALAGTESAGQFNGSLNYERVYTKWDKDKQYAPYVARLAPENAMMVVQENVLGVGKVAFLQCKSAFTDWYENIGFGNSVLSWLIGMPVKEHAKKVQDAAGGPGEIVVQAR